jgi:hypothetical protein
VFRHVGFFRFWAALCVTGPARSDSMIKPIASMAQIRTTWQSVPGSTTS